MVRISNKTYLDLITKKIPQDATPADVVSILLEAGLLNESAVRQLIIFLEFPATLRACEGRYSDAYNDLALKHKISPRMVRKILSEKRNSKIE